MATPLPYDLIRELEDAAEELATRVPYSDGPAHRLIAVARLVVVEARGGAAPPPSEP